MNPNTPDSEDASGAFDGIVLAVFGGLILWAAGYCLWAWITL